MDLTLTPFTLIPLGSLTAVLGVVWYLSKKMTALSEVQTTVQSMERVLAEVLRKVDFDRHVQEDAAFHAAVGEKISTHSIIQARTDERLGNIERSLLVIQTDVRKVLEK